MNKQMLRKILFGLLLLIMPLVLFAQNKKETKIPEGMVLIPAGEFWMGSTEAEAKNTREICKRYFIIKYSGACPWDWLKGETPKHRVYLDAYFIDKFEVTSAHYKECVNVGKCSKPVAMNWYNDSSKANHPVVYVNWHQAGAYCKWLGKRLPTEAEWEKAARGEKGNIYPWGNEFDCNKSCSSASPCKQESTCAVGNFKSDVSPYGVYDMAGNVFEWVFDWYDRNYYAKSSEKNPEGPSNGQSRVLRGGAWGEGIPIFFRGAVRDADGPDS